MNSIPRRGVLALGLGTLASLSGCLGFSTSRETSESFERSFPAADVATLQVLNPVGGVTVVADDGDEVRVRVVKRVRGEGISLDDVVVSMPLDDGELAIETVLPDRAPARFQTASATITVTVPTGDAGPAVQSIASVVGEISLSGTRGDTVVRGDVGDIAASNVDGYLSLSTQVGTVTANDVTGLDRATTEVGDLKVDLLGLRGDVEAGTDVGDVVVGVRDDLLLDVLAESNGRVDSDLSLSELVADGNRLTGRLNGGGHRLHAYSDVGDVSLRALRSTA